MPNAIQKPTPITTRGSASTKDIAALIYSRYTDLKKKRNELDTKWDNTYMMYRGSTEDMRSLKKESFKTGSTRNWKHHVNTGKTFEVVETLVAYLKGATFPSDDWFDASALEPNLSDAANIVKHLAKFKMEEVGVRDVYEQWLRNLIIFGCATMKVGWDSHIESAVSRTYDDTDTPVDVTYNKEVEKLVIESVLPYDVWIDGCGSTFCKLDIDKYELKHYIDTEYYELSEELVCCYDNDDDTDTDIVEFYGPVLIGGAHYRNVHAVFFGNTLIRLADSQYWCGSPYITGTMLPDRDSVYGMTVLDPSKGALHTLNILCNARLDNIAVSIDKMFTMVDDGITRQEDVYTEPGKVFKVAQHGSIQPLDLGPPTFTLGYQEAQVQEGSIDRNCSTGPLIGGGQPRGGERVTAQEILAVQNSGGNRLASVHSHIEDSVTSKLLSKVFMLMQQYVVTPQMVKVFVPEADSYGFFELDPNYLSFPYTLKPNGAAYVVEKQRQIGDLMTLFDIAGRVPQLADKLDFERILVEVLKHMRFTNPSSYIKSAPPVPAAPPLPANEPSPALDGVGMAALQRTIGEDGGASLLGGVGIDTSAMDPAMLQQMSQQVMNDGASIDGGAIPTGTDPSTGLPPGLPPF